VNWKPTVREFFAFVWAAIALFAPGIVLGEVRLAVIDRGRAPEIADYLMAKLTRRNELVLIERNEVDRVLQEQAVTMQDARTDYARLGRLLRAEGVIVLSHAQVQQHDLLVATLVSATLGIRLDSYAVPYPIKDLELWSANLEDRFGVLFPKLGVPSGDAIPLSLLNLRSAVEIGEAKGLERSLSFLLAERLVREREVFVLERQYLGAMEIEKEFVAGPQQPEWVTGRFIVDGEIDASGSSPDRIVLKVKIEPPQGQSPTVLEVTGSQGQLAQLVEATAAKILTAIGRSTGHSGWEPLEEAQRFWRESESAMRIGLEDQALAAAEASYALGCRKEELTGMIVRLNCRRAFSGRGDLSAGYSRAQVDEKTLDIDLVQRSLDLVNDQMKGSPGLDVLLTASRIIRYYRETDRYDEHHAQLEKLRATLRATVDRLVTQGETRSFEFCGFVASYAPYLYDDPRQAIDCYRLMLKQRFPTPYATTRARHYLTLARDKPTLFDAYDLSQRTPWLLNWKHYSQEDLAQVWNAFLDELSRSDKVSDRLDALLLRLSSVDNDPARNALVNQIQQSILSEHMAVGTDKFTYAIVVELLYAIEGEEEFRFKLLNSFLKEANFYDWQILENGFRGKPVEVSPGRLETGFHDPKLATALLESMDAYAARMKGQRDFQPAEFAQYRRRLLDVAPKEINKETPRTLQLQQFWHPFLNKKLIGQTDVFFMRKVIYRDGNIWMLGKVHDSNKGLTTMKVIQVHPQTFEATSFDVPLTYRTSVWSWPEMDSDFDVNRQYVFVAVQGKLFRYDREKQVWDSTEVPATDLPALFLLGEHLYYTFPGYERHWKFSQPDSGIIRIHAQSLEHEVLASSRRKQFTTLLDNVPIYRISSMFIGPGGEVHAVVHLSANRPNAQVLRYSEGTKAWSSALINQGDLWAFPTEGATLLQRLGISSRGAQFSEMRLDKNGQLEYLIGSDDNSPDVAGQVRWLAPENPWDYSTPPTTPLVASTDGKEYWVLLKRLSSSGDSLALYRYQPGCRPPTVIPISFANTRTDHRVANLDPSLFATPQGLLLCNAGGAAFWPIPWQEINEFFQADSTTAPDTETGTPQLNGRN
jgi:hypothetical protein